MSNCERLAMCRLMIHLWIVPDFFSLFQRGLHLVQKYFRPSFLRCLAEEPEDSEMFCRWFQKTFLPGNPCSQLGEEQGADKWLHTSNRLSWSGIISKVFFSSSSCSYYMQWLAVHFKDKNTTWTDRDIGIVYFLMSIWAKWVLEYIWECFAQDWKEPFGHWGVLCEFFPCPTQSQTAI